MATSSVMKSNPRLARRLTARTKEKKEYICDSCHAIAKSEDIEDFYENGWGDDALWEQMNNADAYDVEGEMGESTISATLEVEYKCPTDDCDAYITVSVEVSADALYDSDNSDCGFGSSFNGWGNVNFQGIEEKAQDELKKKAVELDTIPIPLCIIAKTRFNAGFCYLGFSREDQCIIRPIYNTDVENCCWGQNHELDLGKWYSFHAYKKQEDLTVLPHSKNDLVVTNKYDEGLPVEDLYSLLEPHSKKNTMAIFGTSDQYVNEGTDCHSLGVIKIKRKNVRIETVNRKKRIWLGEQNMSYTNVEHTDLSSIPENDDILVLVGLARPWQADWFEGKRCYILGLSVICQLPKSIGNKRANTFEDGPSTSKKIR